ncbi:MAG: MtrB/PioB family outer membrane beta-barrel protein [Marinobacterium sp.]|nr:MtrB/PioB family outer membrane beta-barrel protein [Marinobacterium sp.]
MLSSSSGWADADLQTAVDQLRQLSEQGQSQLLWQQASKMEAELAGDPQFDFYYGMAAVDTGHADEGVMALERVLLHYPENDRVRLEYARGLYLIGDNEMAERAFQQVLEREPPDAVAIRINRYLKQIELRQKQYLSHWSFYAQAGLGYDSNLNSAPEDQLDRVQLTEGSLGKGDSFSDLRAGGSFSKPLDRENRLLFSGSLEQKLYEEESEFNTRTFNLSAGWLHKLTPLQRLRSTLKVQNYNSGGSTYRNRAALALDWNWNLNNTLGVGLNASLSQLKYPDSSLAWRDAEHYTLGASLYKTLPLWHSPILFFNAFYGEETPDATTTVSRASVQRKLAGASLGLQWPLSDQHQLTLSGFYQNAQYGGPDWLYAVVRDDDYHALSLGWNYKVSDSLSLNSNLSLIRSRSSIELYDYEREVFSLNLKYEY